MSNKSPKRIVIIGSAGVGKTSLLEALKEKNHLKIIPEQARVVCKKLGYKNIYEIEDPTSFRILTLKEQIKLEERYKQFISDRGTIDCWIHWVRWSWGTRKTFETEEYFKLAYKAALKYSHILYIPRLTKTKAKEDGFRWNNEEYQNQIDRMFREILLEWQLMNKTYLIRSKDLRGRIKEASEYIN